MDDDISSSLPRLGSRAQVFRGTARQTAGGLRKEHLIRNKRGRIVPKSRHTHGLRALQRLIGAGTKRKY